MSLTVEEVEAVLRLRDEMSAKLGMAQSKLQSFGASARAIGLGMTAAITVPMTLVGKAALDAGMMAVESENLFEVSFGGMADSARKWSVDLNKRLGLNQFELRKTSATLFVMLDSMGLAEDAAYGMSTGMVELAADMASFYNLSDEDAFNKIRAGITGEMEPLKRLGILLDEETVKFYAYANGIAEAGTKLTQQQKVLARYGSMMEQTSKAQGDLGRTMESPVNQLRIMSSRVEEAKTAFGMALLPSLKSVTGFMSGGLVPALEGAVKWFGGLSEPVRKVAVALAVALAAAGPIIGAAGIFMAALPMLAALGFSFAGVATGIAAVPVAFASWEVGKWIGELTGMTDAVEDLAGKYIFGLTPAEIEASRAARAQAEALKNTVRPTEDLEDAAGDLEKSTEDMVKDLLAAGSAAAVVREEFDYAAVEVIAFKEALFNLDPKIKSVNIKQKEMNRLTTRLRADLPPVADAIWRMVPAIEDLALAERIATRDGKIFANITHNIQTAIDDTKGSFDEFHKPLKQKFGEMVGSLRTAATSFGNLARIAGGSLQGIMEKVGLVISTLDTTISTVNSLKDTFTAIKSWFTSGGFDAVFGAFKKLGGWLGRTTDAASGAAQGFSSVGTAASGAAETASTAGAGMASTLGTVAAIAGVAAAAISLIASAFKSADFLASRFFDRVVAGGKRALKVIDEVDHQLAGIGPWGTGSTEYEGDGDGGGGNGPGLAHGGRITQSGMAYVHAGETVRPATANSDLASVLMVLNAINATLKKQPRDFAAAAVLAVR